MKKKSVYEEIFGVKAPSSGETVAQLEARHRREDQRIAKIEKLHAALFREEMAIARKIKSKKITPLQGERRRYKLQKHYYAMIDKVK